SAGNGRTDAGEAYVLFGPLSGPTIDLRAAVPPRLTILGAFAGDGLGQSIATGDVGGGTASDLLISAPSAVGRTPRPAGGGAFAFFSPLAPGTWDLLPTPASVEVWGADPDDELGTGIA